MAKKELKDRKDEIEALVVLVKKGDHDAFSQLYDIFVDPLYRYIYFRVNNQEVEDLMEIVFLKVWENIKKYTPKNKMFSAWFFRIAHNVVVDHYRSQKNETEDLPINVPAYKREHNPIKNTENRLHNEALRNALKNLKENYREVLVYKFLNDLSNPEIAEIMDKSEGSVRILQFRALKALKAELVNMGIKYQF